MKIQTKAFLVKGFWTVFRNLDINGHFKKRDRDWQNIDRDFCVYVWRDKTGIIYYIGMGRFINGKWSECRPFLHRKDLLSNTIDPSWICEIWFYGCSSKEAHIVEAYLISICTKDRSRRSQYIWDGESLINKRRERKYERMIKEYLNLDGNNYWETLRREINNY